MFDRPKSGHPSPVRRSERGVTYIALLVAVTIIGISMGVVGKYWQNIMAREKEQELMFRGVQYVRAVQSYYGAKFPHVLPQSIDDLIKDDRFPQARRHLRQRFLDPATGEEFELMRDKTRGNRIYGVKSTSAKEPIKKENFPEEVTEWNLDLTNKERYSDWEFKFVPQVQPQPMVPGQPVRAPRLVPPPPL